MDQKIGKQAAMSRSPDYRISVESKQALWTCDAFLDEAASDSVEAQGVQFLDFSGKWHFCVDAFPRKVLALLRLSRMSYRKSAATTIS
jgi:hypothetical protein